MEEEGWAACRIEPFVMSSSVSTSFLRSTRAITFLTASFSFKGCLFDGHHSLLGRDRLKSSRTASSAACRSEGLPDLSPWRRNSLFASFCPTLLERTCTSDKTLLVLWQANHATFTSSPANATHLILDDSLRPLPPDSLLVTPPLNDYVRWLVQRLAKGGNVVRIGWVERAVSTGSLDTRGFRLELA
jgi:hypothetical protein